MQVEKFHVGMRMIQNRTCTGTEVKLRLWGTFKGNWFTRKLIYNVVSIFVFIPGGDDLSNGGLPGRH